MELLGVSPHKIFLDNPDAARFSFSYEPYADPVPQLLEKAGSVTNPLSLRRIGEQYEIVCGFKRASAHSLRYKSRKMPAIVYGHGELTDEQCLWLNLLEGEGAGRLSAIEQAIVLQKFSGIGYDTDRLVTEIAPCIGLPQAYTYVENHVRLLSLDSEILRCVHKGEFGVEQAFLLLCLKSEEALALFKLLKFSKANLNETRELIPLILDTAALQDAEPTGFISTLMKELRGSEPNSPRKRLHLLRESLKKERYPTLSAAEAKFNEVIGHLALGNKCRIDAPRYFEGEEITVTIRASNYEQLHEVLQKLLSADGRKKIHMLFSVLKGEHSE
jgi:hypothetical protein